MMIFYPDNTTFRRTFRVSVINKQSENNHFKVFSVIFEVLNGNLQNIGVLTALTDQV